MQTIAAKKKDFNKACRLIGLFNETISERDKFKKSKINISEESIAKKIKDRETAKKVGNYKLADKIREELNWEPKEDFQSGIVKTISWYLNNNSWWEPIQQNKYKQERL